MSKSLINASKSDIKCRVLQGDQDDHAVFKKENRNVGPTKGCKAKILPKAFNFSDDSDDDFVEQRSSLLKQTRTPLKETNSNSSHYPDLYAQVLNTSAKNALKNVTCGSSLGQDFDFAYNNQAATNSCKSARIARDLEDSFNNGEFDQINLSARKLSSKKKCLFSESEASHFHSTPLQRKQREKTKSPLMRGRLHKKLEVDQGEQLAVREASWLDVGGESNVDDYVEVQDVSTQTGSEVRGSQHVISGISTNSVHCEYGTSVDGTDDLKGYKAVSSNGSESDSESSYKNGSFNEAENGSDSKSKGRYKKGHCESLSPKNSANEEKQSIESLDLESSSHLSQSYVEVQDASVQVTLSHSCDDDIHTERLAGQSDHQNNPEDKADSELLEQCVSLNTSAAAVVKNQAADKKDSFSWETRSNTSREGAGVESGSKACLTDELSVPCDGNPQSLHGSGRDPGDRSPRYDQESVQDKTAGRESSDIDDIITNMNNTLYVTAADSVLTKAESLTLEDSMNLTFKDCQSNVLVEDTDSDSSCSGEKSQILSKEVLISNNVPEEEIRNESLLVAETDSEDSSSENGLVGLPPRDSLYQDEGSECTREHRTESFGKPKNYFDDNNGGKSIEPLDCVSAFEDSADKFVCAPESPYHSAANGGKEIKGNLESQQANDQLEEPPQETLSECLTRDQHRDRAASQQTEEMKLTDTTRYRSRKLSDSSDDDNAFDRFVANLKAAPKVEDKSSLDKSMDDFIDDDEAPSDGDSSVPEEEMFHIKVDNIIEARRRKRFPTPADMERSSSSSESDNEGAAHMKDRPILDLSSDDDLLYEMPHGALDQRQQSKNPRPFNTPEKLTPTLKPSTSLKSAENKLPLTEHKEVEGAVVLGSNTFDEDDDFKTPFKTPRKPARAGKPWERNVETPAAHSTKRLDTKTCPMTISKFTSRRSNIGLDDDAVFLKSLSEGYPDYKRHPAALSYVKSFKDKREALTKKLFNIFNKTAFEEQLPQDLELEWSSLYRKTAGSFVYRKSAGSAAEYKIVLSAKVCDRPERVRDTLAHEMCHAAVRLISEVKESHGPVWRSWAQKINRTFPFMPVIARCHDYVIATKYTYKCSRCNYRIGRHSKSLDTDSKVCGYCLGKFEVYLTRDLNSSTEGRGTPATPRTPRTPNKFALFVKESYSEVKKKNKDLKHGDLMKIISQQFAQTKISDV